MTDIYPGIIGDNFKDVAQKLNQLEGLTPWAHIDVMDGTLVPRKVWSSAEDLKQINGRIKIEAHLMIKEPEETLVNWLENVDRVIIHQEATDKLPEIIDAVGSTQCKLGLALMLNTPIEAIYPYLEDADFKIDTILLMSIAEIGYSGHPFDKKVLESIKDLRAEFPNVTIKVDGGINLETGKQALLAGASSLVANSVIWESDDIKKTIKEFQKL